MLYRSTDFRERSRFTITKAQLRRVPREGVGCESRQSLHGKQTICGLKLQCSPPRTGRELVRKQPVIIGVTQFGEDVNVY